MKDDPDALAAAYEAAHADWLLAVTALPIEESEMRMRRLVAARRALVRALGGRGATATGPSGARYTVNDRGELEVIR